MRKITATLITLSILILFLAGCTCVWSDKVFILDFAKARDVDEFSLISEPNYIEFRGKKWHVDPDDGELYTPYGILKTKGESK